MGHVKAIILIRTTQTWKQTLPPSDWTLYYTYVSEFLIVNI